MSLPRDLEAVQHTLKLVIRMVKGLEPQLADLECKVGVFHSLDSVIDPIFYRARLGQVLQLEDTLRAFAPLRKLAEEHGASIETEPTLELHLLACATALMSIACDFASGKTVDNE